jgi:hypothetical protein
MLCLPSGRTKTRPQEWSGLSSAGVLLTQFALASETRIKLQGDRGEQFPKISKCPGTRLQRYVRDDGLGLADEQDEGA